MTPQQIDTSLQTNFIPKAAPAAPGGMKLKKPKQPSLLFSLGLFLFIAAALLIGGLYGFLYLKQQDIATLEQSLAQVAQQVDGSVLAEIEAADEKLKLAEAIYEAHTVRSPLLAFLGENTLPEVAYAGFTYADGGQITMNGIATGYQAIAQQSDIFSASPDVVDHIFSGFQLGPDGRVSFSLKIDPNPDLTSYASSQ